MSRALEDRLHDVEVQVAVNAEILRRIEADLKVIADSTRGIQNVVSRWKGGLGVLILILSAMIAAVAGLLDWVKAKQ